MGNNFLKKPRVVVKYLRHDDRTSFVGILKDTREKERKFKRVIFFCTRYYNIVVTPICFCLMHRWILVSQLAENYQTAGQYRFPNLLAAL